MKNIALIALSVATVVFASLYLRQSGRTIQAQMAAESLQQKVGELQAAAEEQEKAGATLRTELKQVQADASAREREIAQLKTASASAAGIKAGAGALAAQGAAKPANPLSSLAKVFEDPEMKEAIMAQQKAVLGQMLDKTYGKLFSDMGLTPEQATTLKEMLLKKQLAGAEIGMSMLSEGADPSKTAEMRKSVQAATESAEAEIKAFLGDEKFAQLKTYEKSAADRMAITGFKDQLGANAALSSDQEQQLVDAMTQARQNFKFTTDFSDKSKMTGDFQSIFNEENVKRYIEESDQLNQQFISHAQNILTPAQFETFQKFLNNQQAMQKMGMQMGAKMFAPAKQGQ